VERGREGAAARHPQRELGGGTGASRSWEHEPLAVNASASSGVTTSCKQQQGAIEGIRYVSARARKKGSYQKPRGMICSRSKPPRKSGSLFPGATRVMRRMRGSDVRRCAMRDAPSFRFSARSHNPGREKPRDVKVWERRGGTGCGGAGTQYGACGGRLRGEAQNGKQTPRLWFTNGNRPCACLPTRALTWL
jgi:hypothetical protein